MDSNPYLTLILILGRKYSLSVVLTELNQWW